MLGELSIIDSSRKGRVRSQLRYPRGRGYLTKDVVEMFVDQKVRDAV